MPRVFSQVEFEDAATYARANGCFHLETSAKTGKNVREAFVMVTENLPPLEPASSRDSGAPIAFDHTPEAETKKCC